MSFNIIFILYLLPYNVRHYHHKSSLFLYKYLYKSSRRMIDCDEAVVDVEKNTS